MLIQYLIKDRSMYNINFLIFENSTIKISNKAIFIKNKKYLFFILSHDYLDLLIKTFTLKNKFKKN